MFKIFVTDKRGGLFFFPRGANKSGYLLKNLQQKTKIERFLYISLSIACTLVWLAISYLITNLVLVAGSLVACTIGFLLAWSTYVDIITEGLPVSQISYTEMILEKLTNGDEEEEDDDDDDEIEEEPGPVEAPAAGLATNTARILPVSPLANIKRQMSGFFQLSPAAVVTFLFFAMASLFTFGEKASMQGDARPLNETLWGATILYIIGMFGVTLANTDKIGRTLKVAFWLSALLCWGLAAYNLYIGWPGMGR